METEIYATNFSNYYFAMSILIGVVLVAVAGILEGPFSIHVTKVKNWEFENIWVLDTSIFV